MINPVAIILAFGLLGKEIAIIYVLTGFFGALFIGLIANRFGGEELYYKPAYEKKDQPKINLVWQKPPVWKRILKGIYRAGGDHQQIHRIRYAYGRYSVYCDAPGRHFPLSG